MAHNHKRKFDEYDQEAQRSNKLDEYQGVGQLLAELKNPPSKEPLSSPRSGFDGISLDDSPPDTVPLPTLSPEWQTVGCKKKEKPKRKRAPDEKDRIKYPELICHGNLTAPIRIADLQALTLYTLADGVSPNWVAFKHAHHTRKVVMLMVPGLDKGMLDGTISIEGHSALAYGVEAESSTNGRAKSPICNLDGQKEKYLAWIRDTPAKLTNKGNPIEIKGKAFPQALKPLADMFQDMWPVKAPGDSRYAKLYSPIQAVLVSTLPQSKDRKASKGPRPPAEEKDWHSQRTAITEFIHTAEELRDAEYPLHPAILAGAADAASLEHDRRHQTGQNAKGGWVNTRVSSISECIDSSTADQQGSITSGRTVYAIDCEMVLTVDDKYSLARISVVDWSGKTVLDELVKPSLAIKNYYTQFSGMTKAILDPIQTTLSEIQSKLLDLLTTQTILLGHSLESDLCAMKLTHPFIIDTSLIYPHPRGPPLRSSLKFLSQKYLRRDIQQQDLKGHDSVEDALAVLDLVKLKCEKGPKWGTSEAAGEPIFRRLARSKKKDAGGNERSITSAIVDYGTPERGYGKEATVQIGCENDEEIATAVIRAVNGDVDGKVVPGGGVDFTWARLRELETFRGWCKIHNRDNTMVDKRHVAMPPRASTSGLTVEETEPQSQAPPQQRDAVIDTSNPFEVPKPTPGRPSELQRPPSTPTSPTLQSTISFTISHIHKIHSNLPPCTLFIVYTGTGDPREVSRLQTMQQQYRREFKVKKWDDLSVKWTDDEEQALKRAVERAREGLAFMCVK
jgi:RNA exonuclease 1